METARIACDTIDLVLRWRQEISKQAWTDIEMPSVVAEPVSLRHVFPVYDVMFDVISSALG